MSDWYVSSAAYAAIPAFTPSAAYTVGNIVKPTAPALKAQWAFRCTTAGTVSTEPAWPTANNSTITTGGATFTNVTGQSTYGWAAAAGDIPTLIGAVGTFRFAAGDRMFVSSDHSEAQTASTSYGSGTGTASYSVGQVLSVNRAGSVPPVAADLTAGAAVSISGASSMSFETAFPIYHYGLNVTYAGTGLGIGIGNTANFKTMFFDNCQLILTSVASAAKIFSGQGATLVLNNSPVKLGAIGQGFSANGGPMELIWLNTPNALVAGSSVPTTLFSSNTNRDPLLITARGVDLSLVTSLLLTNTAAGSKVLLDSCRIAPGVARYSLVSINNTRDLLELVNCYDGTHFISESYQPAGAVTTEFTNTLSSGATDDVGTFSHKMVSNANIDKSVNMLNGFWMDVENQAVGASKTATVEIVSSASLNNDDISLLLEYQGAPGSSVASFVSSLPANVLTANAALPTSTATWNSLPATPVKQKLQATFTPQVAGRVRGQVRLGKPSTTVYVNPFVTIA